jgi:hydroxyacylglutathione hydrolase
MRRPAGETQRKSFDGTAVLHFGATDRKFWPMTIDTIVVGEFQVNCIIISDTEKNAVVIDPGSDADLIQSYLNQHGLTVAGYMLTHGHMDHISALAELHDAYPAPIGMHPEDSAWAFTNVNEMLPFYGVPRQPSQIKRSLKDGQIWKDGDISIQIIETPGHTPGGVCFLLPDANALIVGDTLFAGSAGRTDLRGGNSRVLQQSLRRLQTLDDSLKVYPGHGPTTTIGREKRTNFFMQG